MSNGRHTSRVAGLPCPRFALTLPYAPQIASTAALLIFGAVGAWLGGAKRIRAALRVLVGGWLAMGVTFGTCPARYFVWAFPPGMA